MAVPVDSADIVILRAKESKKAFFSLTNTTVHHRRLDKAEMRYLMEESTDAKVD